MVSPELRVSACLITWKRQYNLPEIIKSLVKWDFIDEILITDHSKSDNLMSYGRYELAKRARNEIVYFQDDDCLIENLDEIYNKFTSSPNSICHSGTKNYENVINDNIYGDSQMALAGWGSFCKKEWFTVLDKYIDKYGKDYCFLRETDRIFSLLRKQKHSFVPGVIEHLRGKDDEFAMSMQVEHLKYKNIAIERALELNGE